jgi:hypothetical protein
MCTPRPSDRVVSVAGLLRIRYVYGTGQCLKGRKSGSSPTSGTDVPQVRGGQTLLMLTKVPDVLTEASPSRSFWR